MNRRGFLGGLVAAAGALVLPKTVEANAEEVRRYWSLGGIPQPEGWELHGDYHPGYLAPFHHYDQVTYEVGQSYYPQGAGGPMTITTNNRVLTVPSEYVRESTGNLDAFQRWIEETEPRDTRLAWLRALEPDEDGGW